DRILLDHSTGLFMVADGMGGHKHGEIAAELAVASLRYYVETSRDRFDATWPFGYDFELSVDANRLATGIQFANQQVWNHAQQTPECAGMGTTIAAILLSDQNTVVGNVGDSRVYLFRGGDLKQISYDDTYVNAIAEREGPSSIDVHNSPMRNVLTPAAGSEQAAKVHIAAQRLAAGDLHLIGR